jgi:cytochrome oxidase assembly protein ShyY1
MGRSTTRLHPMRKFFFGLLLLLVLAAIVGFVGLGFWQFPPPTQTMEKTIPNDRFSQ